MNMPRQLLIVFFLVGMGSAIAADEAYTGWRETQTEHFTFVFEERDGGAVGELLSFCEEIYGEITKLFDSYPDHVLCIVRGRTDYANGSFYPFPAHLNLHVTSPTWPNIDTRGENWLRILLTHEFTHYVQNMYDKGITAGFARVFGKGLEPIHGGFIPGWLVEGPAIVAETEFTGGGRGRNAFFEMYYKAPILENSLFTSRQAGHPSPFPPPGRIWVAGYMVSDYMYQTYGSSTFADIQKEFVKFPFFGPGAAIKRVTGRSPEEIYSNMKLALQSRYREDAQIDPGKTISPEGYGNYFLPIPTDAGLIGYRYTLSRSPALVLKNETTGKERILKVVALTDPSSFTADAAGDQVVYSAVMSRTGAAGQIETSDLYQLSTDTGQIKRLTKNAHLWHPALSADGRRLVAIQKRGSYSDLVEVELTTGEISPLYSHQSDTVHNPAFSHDGRHVAFVHSGNIWLLTEGETVPRKLTDVEGGGEFFPRFNGDSVVFSSDRGGSLAIYQADIKNPQEVLLVAEDPVGAYAGYVQDGRVVYASYSSAGYILKQKTAVLADPPSLEVEPSSIDPVVPIFFESTRYTDRAKLLYWVPLPLYIDPLGELQLIAGAGLMMYGSSPLGRLTWQTIVTSRFDVFQPGAEFAMDMDFHVVSASIQLAQGYREISSPLYPFVQETRETLGLAVSVVDRYLFPWSAQVEVGTSLRHRLLVYGADSFAITQSFEQDIYLNLVSVLPSFSVAFTRYGTQRDFFDPFTFQISGLLDLPIYSSASPPLNWSARTNLMLQLPSPIPHQRFRPQVKLWYTESETPSFNEYSLRGGFLPETPDTPGAFIASLEYIFHVALLDAPLPFGLHLKQLAGAIHFDAPGSFDLTALAVTLNEVYYVGGELTILIGTSLHIPLGIGVNVELDVSQLANFDALVDIRPYFYIGADSFFNAYP